MQKHNVAGKFHALQLKRRKRGGVSTIIGTLIFLLILMIAFFTFFTIFGYYNSYSQNVAKFSQAQQRFEETSVSLGGFSFGSLPTTAALANSSSATGGSFERKLFFDQNLWWLFYSKGTSINYVTSSGVSWSALNVVTSSNGSASGFDFALWQNGNSVYYALTSNATSFSWRYGSLESSGAILWTIPETSVASSNVAESYPSIVVDSMGNVWVALSAYNGSASSIQVLKYVSGIWNLVHEVSPVNSGSVPMLVPLASGVCLIYGNGGAAAQVSIETTTDGSVWSSTANPASYYSLFSSSATAIGNTVYFVGLASQNLGSSRGTVNSFTFSGGVISPESVLDNATSNWAAAISQISPETVVAFYGTNNTVYARFVFGAAAWYPPETISTQESSLVGLSSSYSGTGALWQSGNSIRFASLPVVITTNNSPFAVHLVSLYVYNPSTQVLVHYDTNSTAQGVSGSFDYWIGAGEGMAIPLPIFAWSPSQNYLVTMATDEGVLTSESFVSPS